MMHDYIYLKQIKDNFPWSILLQNDVNNMFKTQVEPVGIRCIFFSCDLLSVTCVLYLSSCVCVCWRGGGWVGGLSPKNSPQLGYGYFLEKKKNIFFQAPPVKLNNGSFMPSIALG